MPELKLDDMWGTTLSDAEKQLAYRQFENRRSSADDLATMFERFYGYTTDSENFGTGLKEGGLEV